MVQKGGSVGILTRKRSKVMCKKIDISENVFGEDLLVIKCLNRM